MQQAFLRRLITRLLRTLPPVLLGVVLFTAVGCTLKHTYDVKGRVVGFGDDGRTVLIEHEDIAGYMPAMTMSFKTHEREALEGIHLHDALQFKLVVTGDSSWIEQLMPLPDSAVATHPAGMPDPMFSPSAAPSILSPGDSLPPFTLLDQDAKTIQRANFEGRALLLNFIYTRCPLPDYCPRLSRHFQTLQPLVIDRYGDGVRQLSISFDPAYDTPEVLHAYGRSYTDNTEQWTFATGTPEQVEQIAQRFGIYYAANGAEFDHNLATALIRPDGRVARIWRGNTWQPEEIIAALEKVMKE